MLRKIAFIVAALATLLASGGCASGPAAAAPDQNLYQRLGGREAINAVVVDAIGNVSVDARINRRFANIAAAQLSTYLVDLVCVRAGGPCSYTGHNMADAHEGMFISDAEFDALVEDLAKSLDKFNVPAREKRESLAMLYQMRNSIVGH